MEWKMPDLGEGVQEGEIVKWLVKEGETVSMDQPLVEVMTDKATMELPSPVEGKIEKLLVQVGDIIKVGHGMALLGGGAAKSSAPAQKKEPKAQPAAVERIKRERLAPAASVGSGETAGEARLGKALASPAVRYLARELNVDLQRIPGSGPGGRILKSDVEQVAGGGAQLPAQGGSGRFAGPTPPPLVSYGPEKREPLRGLRRKIAEHMVLSRRTATHFAHFDEIDMTSLVKLRNKEKMKAKKAGVKLTFLPYIIQAVIEGLKKYPSMNASLDENSQEVVLKEYFNIGVAVATPNGLIVPNIKDADKKDLYTLARETVRLSEAVRGGKFAVEEVKGGTFTLTNIGSIGGILSTPIINYPEVAIMGLHQIKERPMVVKGKVKVRSVMYVSVSADHRVVDGAEVARFVNVVKEKIEGAEFS